MPPILHPELDNSNGNTVDKSTKTNDFTLCSKKGSAVPHLMKSEPGASPGPSGAIPLDRNVKKQSADASTKRYDLMPDEGAEAVLEAADPPTSEQPEISPHAVPIQIAWRSLIIISSLHMLAIWGLWRACTVAMWQSVASAFVWGWAGGLGITAGAHRLWAHRAYQANLPYRVLLMLLQTLAGENDIYEWVRDHRLHHRHSETHADPHNACRGFWFAHCGWLVVRKHPEVLKQGAKTDMSDLLADPVVTFQRRYYVKLMLLITFVIPTLLAVFGWGENLLTAYLVCGCFKYVATLHTTWLVNSAAHLWGMHPYDDTINPAENRLVAWAAMGEGWHNYHHVFPWDYRAAELPGYWGNVTTGFIDLFAWLGWTYNRKVVDREAIRRRALRKGDGSWKPPQGAKELKST